MKKIVTDPKIMLGKPTIVGTRITVELILNLMEHGQTVQEIMEDYDLTAGQIKAALEYAKRALEKVYPTQTAVAHEIFIRRKYR